MSNSFEQLSQLIDSVREAGKDATVTVLPSAVNRNHKSQFGVKRAASRRRCGKAQMQYKLYHTSGHWAPLSNTNW